MTNQILALPNECWRWYDGYEGIAQVSTRGQVQTVDRWITDKNGRKKFLKGRILKPSRDRNGYLYVNLCRNNKPRHFHIHRMVAETWIDNPENKPQVNHLDEDKSNNDVYNLSWCSPKENNNWGSRNKRAADSRLNGSLSKPVQAINPETGLVVLEFSSVSEAGRKGFTESAVSLCCRGIRLKTHRGFVWRFKP